MCDLNINSGSIWATPDLLWNLFTIPTTWLVLQLQPHTLAKHFKVKHSNDVQFTTKVLTFFSLRATTFQPKNFPSLKPSQRINALFWPSVRNEEAGLTAGHVQERAVDGWDPEVRGARVEQHSELLRGGADADRPIVLGLGRRDRNSTL